MKHLLSLFCLMSLCFSANAQKITGNYEVPDVPDWAKNAVFYQIYPQTFCDSDGDGIGDIKGIISKLDYVKSLGVDAIWFNPFFDSPFLDAGYDIRDYYRIAPRYGTNEDAKQLFEEIHKRGMHVIFDYVISYTSIDNPWFKESCKQEPNKYSNYYIWTETNWVDPPREFAGQFIKGYAQRNGQYMRNFYWCQPALNFGFANPDPNQPWQLPTDHPDVVAMKNDLKDVLRFWMDMGCDGFRADMAGALVKTRQTRGNEQFFTTNENATKLFWREIRELLEKEYPGSLMVAEWSFPSDALDKCFHVDFFHWFNGYNDLFQKESWRILNGCSEGHSFFDKEGKGNITDFLTSYMEQYEKTVGKGYISLPLGNHDNARIANTRTDKELEIIYAFGFTMPGLPFIYYGNEIGMKQLPTTWPQVEGAYQPRNGARTPMQWTSGKNLGFSTGDASKLYLPVDPAADAPNVEAEEADPNSLLNRTRKLIALRHSEPALANYAEFVPVYAEKNTYPFVYARAAGKDVVLVMLNPRAEASEATFEVNTKFSKTKLLAGDKFKITHDKKTGKVSVSMPATSYAIVKLQ
ncbi:MAG: alpha-amylase family glycosyl hydrolase [Bacteroidaceae bacterium]|nr:alpha-amylase family glycosyl hydrolase [Bacteroidaceae bacterium]